MKSMEYFLTCSEKQMQTHVTLCENALASAKGGNCSTTRLYKSTNNFYCCPLLLYNYIEPNFTKCECYILIEKKLKSNYCQYLFFLFVCFLKATTSVSIAMKSNFYGRHLLTVY